MNFTSRRTSFKTGGFRVWRLCERQPSPHFGQKGTLLPRQSLELVQRYRRAEEVTLVTVATLTSEERPLPLELHAFGDDGKTQLFRQGDHHLCDGRVVRVVE